MIPPRPPYDSGAGADGSGSAGGCGTLQRRAEDSRYCDELPSCWAFSSQAAVAALRLNPSLDISQYAHNAWTVRDGFSVGTIFAMAQTPDGYLWLGAEFGLFRFDGVRSVPWQPPAGQHLPSAPYSLLVTRDGTLWIGTFAGLVSWSGARLTRVPGAWQTVCDIAARRPGRNSVGRHAGRFAGDPHRPAVRNPKRQRAMLRRGWRLRHRSFGVWVRTAQALSGPAPSPGFGDGNPVLQSGMRRRECASMT